MRVLVIGSGAREHALVCAARRRPGDVDDIVCAPGQSRHRRGSPARVPVDVAIPTQLLALADARTRSISPSSVPKLPLSLGVADRFAAAGRLLFGPTAAAARLESSKAFAKAFMARHGVPTARFRICDIASTTRSRAIHAGEFGFPVVLKADGLAAGKGVVIAADRRDGRATRSSTHDARTTFGAAGDASSSKSA